MQQVDDSKDPVRARARAPRYSRHTATAATLSNRGLHEEKAQYSKYNKYSTYGKYSKYTTYGTYSKYTTYLSSTYGTYSKYGKYSNIRLAESNPLLVCCWYGKGS